MSPRAGTTGLTWADLRALPADGVRREIVDGVLHVNPPRTWRHQRVVARLCAQLVAWADAHGADVAAGPTIYFTEADVVEPDVVLAGPDRLDRVQELRFMGAPDLIAEVSSPASRRHDVVRKRRLYEAHGVGEFWFVDLEADRVEAYRLDGAHFGHARTHRRGDVIAPPRLNGLEASVGDLLGPPDE